MDPQTRRNELYGLLGDLPPRDLPIAARTVDEVEQDGYVLQKLVLELNGIEPVPAYFVKPDRGGTFPVMLYNHAHGGDYVLGKDELILGRPALQKPCYARELASRGIAALCVDTWVFGERRGRSESEVFKQMLWEGRVLWGMMVYDSLRAVDYLCSRSDVDHARIGTMGISMGSTMAWWVAALDARVKLCIDLCCLTDYQSLIESRGLDGHGIYYYVPSLLKHFTAAQINELIAPRAHLGLAGNYDPLTPPDGLDRIDRELKRVYASCGVPEKWALKRYETGHFETADMRHEIIEFMMAHL
jgi:dienelactone hydrolase